MKYLLDTSAWYFGIAEPKSIPPDIQEILNSHDMMFGLSAISIWEIGKKHQIGKMELKRELGAWLKEALGFHINVLPLTLEIVTDAMSLPDFPNRDPADELIVATARIHKLTLLTTDTLLKNYRHAKVQYFKPVEPKR